MHPALRDPGVGVAHLNWVVRTGAIVLTLIQLGCGSDPSTPELPRIGRSTPEELIQNLGAVYQQRNYVAFENLFPNANDNIPIDPTMTGQLRIHRRMFNPESPLPGETPVPQELWLQSITITLARVGTFTERPDLYRSPMNPDGLDANVWKATDCLYHAVLLFDTQGPTDYPVDCLVNFVVIENLNKPRGENRKFLIDRWEELGGQSGCSWSAVLSLYAD